MFVHIYTYRFFSLCIFIVIFMRSWICITMLYIFFIWCLGFGYAYPWLGFRVFKLLHPLSLQTFFFMLHRSFTKVNFDNKSFSFFLWMVFVSHHLIECLSIRALGCLNVSTLEQMLSIWMSKCLRFVWHNLEFWGLLFVVFH
jgi:hypothetical protein